MNTYKAWIEYLGTHYNGFQKQNSGVPTIQNTIEDVLKKISGKQNISTLASGRTDAGVHAREQIIKITLDNPIPEVGLKKALNDLLPTSIRIRNVEKCPQSFHPIRDSLWKEYHYRFSFNQELDPDLSLFVTNYYGEIDIEKMKKAAKIFEGEHDFCNYQTVGTEVDSTIRSILHCEIQPIEMFSTGFGQHSNSFQLTVRGTGFLKQMVRLMMGTLIECGRNKVTAKDIENSLKSEKLANKLGPVAPPQGLILYQVKYPENAP